MLAIASRPDLSVIGLSASTMALIRCNPVRIVATLCEWRRCGCGCVFLESCQGKQRQDQTTSNDARIGANQVYVVCQATALPDCKDAQSVQERDKLRQRWVMGCQMYSAGQLSKGVELSTVHPYLTE